MAVLLTGASGFIGRHTADFLSQKKISFVGLSRHVGKYKKVDLNKPLNVSGDFSGVIHLAAKKHLEKNESEVEYLDNLLGTFNVLDFCRKKDIPKIIFSSSMSIYGKNFFGKLTKNTKINPQSMYGLSKKMSEDAVIYYSNLYGIGYTILRYSSVFGRGQGEKNKLSEIVHKCQLNQKIVFPEDSVRNFIYVKDVARANFLALKSKKNAVLNIGGKENVSLAEAAKVIKKTLKSKSEIEIGKKSKSKFKIDLESARKTIRFFPEFSFQEGIKETILPI